jgi:hypothetical protein
VLSTLTQNICIRYARLSLGVFLLIGYLFTFTPLPKAIVFTAVACLSSGHEVVVDGSDVILHHADKATGCHSFLTDCVACFARNDGQGDHRIFCGALLHAEGWEKHEEERSDTTSGVNPWVWESPDQGVFYVLCCQAPRGPCAGVSDLFLSQWNSVKLVI